MTEKLLEFFALLRRNGLRLSTAEALDGLRAVETVGLASAETLRLALGATLVKRREDEALVDDLFELFFLRPGDYLRRHKDEPLLEGLRQRGFTEEEIEALVALLTDEAARMSATARMGLGLGGGRGSMQTLMRQEGVELNLERLTNPMQIGFFTQQLLAALRLREAENDIERLRQRLERTLGAERAAALGEVLAANLGALRQAARRFIADEFERRNHDFIEKWRKQSLTDKPFAQMTDEDVVRLRREVQRLARKLKQMQSLRRRTERRGRLDARRTIRRSLASGGVPFVLKHKRRRVEKPRLIVLCDISDSVRHVSRFMLEFAYTLQDQFSRVRSFVFVADVAEITSLFAEHELGYAVDLAYRGAAVNVFANSNYGRALVGFRNRFLDAVTPRTTVIVIGDGRNNYNPSEAWALGDVRARARRVLWLNPEAPLAWAFGDSAMNDYQPHCDRVAVVHNLASLAKVVDELLI